jgi:hypothetical protein
MRNSKRTKALLLLGAAVAIAALTVGLTSALGGSRTSYKQGVYQLNISTRIKGHTIRTVEFVSLKTGAWRSQVSNRRYIVKGNQYAVVDLDSGSVYHRIGSPSFLGYLRQSDALMALRQYKGGPRTLAARGVELRVGKTLHGRTVLRAFRSGKLLFAATMQRRVSDGEAAKRGLFSISQGGPPDIEREVPVGQPSSLPVRAYWFGRQVNGTQATTATERSHARTPEELALGVGPRADTTVHITLYEAPGAQGRSSAEPGRPAPAGEIQVMSEPVASAHAQGFIDALNGHNGDYIYPAWPRSQVTLANGEQATLVADQFNGDGPVREGFFVITDKTLVHVSGSFPLKAIPTLAQSLRPLG